MGRTKQSEFNPQNLRSISVCEKAVEDFIKKMGAQASKKDKLKNLSNSERSSKRKKYLQQTNGSSHGVNGASEQPACPSIEEPRVELPEFTDRQKHLVTETWRIVQEDMARVGVIMFIK